MAIRLCLAQHSQQHRPRNACCALYSESSVENYRKAPEKETFRDTSFSESGAPVRWEAKGGAAGAVAAKCAKSSPNKHQMDHGSSQGRGVAGGEGERRWTGRRWQRRVKHVQSATRGGGRRAGLGRVKEERLEAVVVGAGGVPRGAGEDGPLGKALPVLGDEVGERLLTPRLGLAGSDPLSCALGRQGASALVPAESEQPQC